MNVIEAIHARRAVRSYSPRAVEEREISSLLGAAVQAPSAMNAQPWSFVVVQDRARLKRYSDRAKSLLLSSAGDGKTRRYEGMLRDENFNVFYDAGTLIVICAKEGGPYVQADCWLAAQNLMLAACEAGLGTCCIGFAVPVLNTPEVKAELGIPSDVGAIAPLIVGYAAGRVEGPVRAEPRILSWIR
ncbi:MAG TPA: nitroreductase family protein [Polyangiaceae bacterium]|nr:nitroreductase family protein [Polyangiaceae bacterium]